MAERLLSEALSLDALPRVLDELLQVPLGWRWASLHLLLFWRLVLHVRLCALGLAVVLGFPGDVLALRGAVFAGSESHMLQVGIKYAWLLDLNLAWKRRLLGEARPRWRCPRLLATDHNRVVVVGVAIPLLLEALRGRSR